MATKPSALGKGLSALIAEADEQSGRPERKVSSSFEYEGLSTVALSDIQANPYQPRDTFDQEDLDDLAASLRTIGLIQPITLRLVAPNKYQIISGERRVRAAQIAGLTHLPAYVRQADDQGMLEMALVENLQRKDLNAIEISLGFQRLIDECNLTQEAMAERMGKNRTTVTNYLRLLKLPPEIQLALRQGVISMGHARALLSIENKEQQLALTEQILRKGLSVRQIEALVQNRKLPKAPSRTEVDPPAELPETYFTLIDKIGQYFGNKISIKRSSRGAGTITIHVSNDRQVEHFLHALEFLKK
ncbi:MAG: ParB/RepB/Spo0J family partition protein [Prevotellaceae bacterium]|jgi:ParB family chromosome partitioning protein|nr:ParB/RepB/Spo0J family partition protein [Prevotellaceae bacterium]